MFETTLAPSAVAHDRREAIAVTVAVVAHVVVLGTAIVVSAITVGPAIDPDFPLGIVFVQFTPPETDPPRPASPQTAPKSGSREPQRGVAAPPLPVRPTAPPDPAREPQLVEEPRVATAGSTNSGIPGTDDGPGDGGPLGPGTDDGRGGGRSDGTEPVYVGGGVVAPELVKRVEPVYPTAARLARMTGRVILQAVVGLDGSVESVEILSSTSPLFDDAARDAVRRWVYRPASMDGRPVRVYFTVRVDFVLR